MFAEKDVIWKHELNFLVFFRNNFESDVTSKSNERSGSGGSNKGGSRIFPAEQHMAAVSFLNFRAWQ